MRSSVWRWRSGGLGLAAGELSALSRASELHDVGKIAIPDAILTKAGPLSDEEWEFMPPAHDPGRAHRLGRALTGDGRQR